jgi:hypothetical protein
MIKKAIIAFCMMIGPTYAVAQCETKELKGNQDGAFLTLNDGSRWFVQSVYVSRTKQWSGRVYLCAKDSVPWMTSQTTPSDRVYVDRVE